MGLLDETSKNIKKDNDFLLNNTLNKMFKKSWKLIPSDNISK